VNSKITSVKHPGKNPGVVTPNERDAAGNPVGHPSFAGGASVEHGLPQTPQESEAQAS
jgi:hypothetical protein